MIFKIVLNNEIHRVNVDLKSFEELTALITKRFSANMPSNYHLEYLDADNDLVRISNEEDFQILLEDFETMKSAKLFIKSHDNETLPTMQELPCDDPIVLIDDSVEEIPLLDADPTH